MNSSFSQAEDRVRRMNSLTRGFIEQSSRPARTEAPSAVVSVPRFEPVQETPVKPPEKPCECAPKKSCTPSNPIDRLFSGRDGERTLIILLIIVLINEKADMRLIAALLYLIL